jgi:putative ABC transport system substrate-binding protein
VASYARPGGNITGAATQTTPLIPKRLQLLHEAVPGARLVADLANPSSVAATDTAKLLAAAADVLGLRIVTVEAHDPAQIEAAFAAFAKAGARALLVMPDPTRISSRSTARSWRWRCATSSRRSTSGPRSRRMAD